MQFFAVPEQIRSSRTHRPPRRNRIVIHVIINNALMSEFATVDNSTLPVISRAYAVMVKSQTKQGLLAHYNYVQRSGNELHIASIDKQIPYSIFNPFDKAYMLAAFQLGYDQTLKGTVWKDRPVFPDHMN